jgi:hypothetical protein
MKKMGVLIGGIVVIVMVVLIGLSLKQVAVDSPQSGMFIGLGLLSDRLAAEEQVILRESQGGGTILTGRDMADLLKSHYSNWHIQENSKIQAAIPDYTVYYNLGSGDKIEFYQGASHHALVIYKGETTAYTIDQATIDDLSLRRLTSDYFLPEQVIEALVSSKRTKLQSLDDVPQTPDFAVLKVGQATFYLYEADGKYYIESPYVFIAEVIEQNYKAALAFAEPISTTEAPTEPTSQAMTTESYGGELGSDFEKVGVLKSGTEVYFKKAGFYNKLEKGEHIVLKSGELAYTLIEGLPGRPEISPNGEWMAFIDVIEFEALGNVFIYRDADGAIEQMTQYAYSEVSTVNSDTVKDCLWLNNEELLMVIGYSVGTITQGGDVYLLDTQTKEKELIFKANKNEEVANISFKDGQYVFEIVVWTDENMMNYVYREEVFTEKQIQDMKK